MNGGKNMKKIYLGVEIELIEAIDNEKERILKKEGLKVTRAELIRRALRNEFLYTKPQKEKKKFGKIVWKIPNNKVMIQDGVFWESNEKIQQYRTKIQETEAGTKERTEALSEYEKMLNKNIKNEKTVDELLLFSED